MTAAALTPTHHAQVNPDAPAIVMASGETTTYGELEERSRRMAAALSARGMEPGGHVAILMENNRQFLEVTWAAQRAGLYYTAINSHLTPGEVQYILEDCGATALVASEAKAAEVAGLDLSSVGVRIAGRGTLPGFESYDDILATTEPQPLADDREGQEMLYSSGTTGRPKGVRKPLSGAALGDPSARSVQTAGALAHYGLGPGSVYLSPAPLYHSAPLVYSMCIHRLGGTVVVMEKFDPELCLQLIEDQRVTFAQFVPTMFVRMLRLPDDVRSRYDLSSLQFAMHAAAPCPIAVKRQMMDWWGPILHEYYAGTEDIGSTYISPQEWLAHPGSVGKPRDECHIVDDDGNELPAGQPGVVYFANDHSFEYHNDPDKTASVANERGWRTIGDIGYLDEDGYLYLTDRAAYMIISGGVNIYPQEAENVLAGHPKVTDVAVIGVPDAEMGEQVKAVVQAVPGVATGVELEAELLDFCKGQLATYKCPKTVDFVDDLPRDDNGKLYKRRLREQYWEGHDSFVI
jgi:fatty-acyl-CoA synthase